MDIFDLVYKILLILALPFTVMAHFSTWRKNRRDSSTWEGRVSSAEAARAASAVECGSQPSTQAYTVSIVARLLSASRPLIRLALLAWIFLAAWRATSSPATAQDVWMAALTVSLLLMPSGD